MDYAPPTENDLATVRTQLGREPNRVVGIAARCPAGHPSVVANYPLRTAGKRPEPFPTLFWLTCPELIKAISRLEMRGLIDELDARLEADDEFASQVAADHAAYRTARWELLAPTDRELAATHGLLPAFQERGIGGIHNLRSVKCLHLHYAHHLAASNTLGALLESAHGIVACPAIR